MVLISCVRPLWPPCSSSFPSSPHAKLSNLSLSLTLRAVRASRSPPTPSLSLPNLTTDMPQMPPLQLLSRMAPLALFQMACSAFAFGEVSDLSSHWQELKEGSTLYAVLVAGIASFSLNLCSLQANKVTSPLTLSIMANVKQVRALSLSLCPAFIGGGRLVVG